MLLINSSAKYKYKRKKHRINLLLLSACFLFAACKQHTPQRKIERSFYYWKSVLRLTTLEKQNLDTLQVNTLYVKFFDVDWDNDDQHATPKAIVRIPDSAYLRTHNINIIPVVFITNECIRKLDSAQVNELAKKISSLLKNIMSDNHIDSVAELQIDCDWSNSTRKNYFSLLKYIKSTTAGFAKSLSCTIRLHQVKYLSLSGVPPVDRGLLMCYNMGDMQAPSATNSILETSELKKYTGSLNSYPLQLDIAFPLFEWCVLFRNDKFKGLIENMDILNAPAVKIKNDKMFFLLRDTTMYGFQFKKDDIIRKETSDYSEIMGTAAEISKRLKTQQLKLSLFHLDSLILDKYPTNELENIYSSLR